MAQPKPTSRRIARHKKSVNLALQGGGSHGAYTWGVLDKLFEDDRIWIEAISGTSAGAMNAVVAAQGMYEGGAEGARTALDRYWRAVSAAGKGSPMQRSFRARARGDWSLDDSPTYIFFNMLSNIVSPYDFNPWDINPFRDLVEKHIDFDKVRACSDMGVFLGATNVETGRAKVFVREEIDIDALLASACLPSLYKAVEKDGDYYWDGGFMGNPPIYPFFYNSPADDVIIVQINPIVREGVPKTASEIHNRMNEITFNSALMHELRSINFVTRLLDKGALDPNEYRRMNMHMIQSRKKMRPLGASSKLNTEWSFLRHLFEIGRGAAERWLAENYDKLGVESSIDLKSMFTGYASNAPDQAAK